MTVVLAVTHGSRAFMAPPGYWSATTATSAPIPESFSTHSSPKALVPSARPTRRGSDRRLAFGADAGKVERAAEDGAAVAERRAEVADNHLTAGEADARGELEVLLDHPLGHAEGFAEGICAAELGREKGAQPPAAAVRGSVPRARRRPRRRTC